MGPTAVGWLLLCALSPSCSRTGIRRALGLRARTEPGRRPVYGEVTSVGEKHVKLCHFNVNESQQVTLNVARCRWISCLLKASHSPSPCSIIFSLYMIKVEKMLFFVFLVTGYCTSVFSESCSRGSCLSMWLLCAPQYLNKKMGHVCLKREGRIFLSSSIKEEIVQSVSFLGSYSTLQ